MRKSDTQQTSANNLHYSNDSTSALSPTSFYSKTNYVSPLDRGNESLSVTKDSKTCNLRRDASTAQKIMTRKQKYIKGMVKDVKIPSFHRFLENAAMRSAESASPRTPTKSSLCSSLEGSPASATGEEHTLPASLPLTTTNNKFFKNKTCASSSDYIKHYCSKKLSNRSKIAKSSPKSRNCEKSDRDQVPSASITFNDTSMQTGGKIKCRFAGDTTLPHPKKQRVDIDISCREKPDHNNQGDLVESSSDGIIESSDNIKHSTTNETTSSQSIENFSDKFIAMADTVKSKPADGTVLSQHNKQKNKIGASAPYSPDLFSQALRSQSSSARTDVSISTAEQPVKLFPIFMNSSPRTLQNNKSPLSKSSSPCSSASSSPSRFLTIPTLGGKIPRSQQKAAASKDDYEQMTLDVGQKKIGATQCDTCGMVYSFASAEDEAVHVKFHQHFLLSLRFPGWKKERVLRNYSDGRVIMILNEDPKYCHKKLDDIRSIVDTDLGFHDASVPSARKQHQKTLLFISEQKIVGCCIAEHIEKGYRMLSGSPQKVDDKRALCCSTESEPAQCGINRIWVLTSHRRKQIATRLIDCLRDHFLFGCSLKRDCIAFSDPTPNGRAFASKYMKTSKFMVYKYDN